ncbi:MAG: flagellar motor protein MotB [Deltaproteobacteria bacterium]|nr:flagellar motor protein MotB [Deltaproteobacteria bacterium]
MSEPDRTREVKSRGSNNGSDTGSDEVFEVGDSAIIDSSTRRPVAQPPSKLPWLLAVLLAAGAAAGFWFFVVPLQDALTLATQRAEAAEKSLEAAKTKLAVVEGELNELRERSSSMEKTLDEQAAQLKELTGTKDELESKLKDEIARGDVLVKQVKGQLVVDLADQILFPSGAADLNDKGKEVLRRVGETMFKASGKVIQVGGHTDNQPISDKLKAQFPSNWELATSRAMNVVHFLEDEVKVPGERLVVTGFGQFRPSAKNTTKEGRKKNRRIEVVLLEKK